MSGLFLLAIAVVTARTMPQVLADSDWAYRCPRLGIGAWYATLAAVTGAVTAALLVWIAPWQGPHALICRLWHWCQGVAGGSHGPASRALMGLCVLTALGLSVRLTVIAVHTARAAAARRRHHRRLLTLVGQPLPQWGVTAIEDPRLAAYMLGGPRREVVVTTGALHALSKDELSAVIAHEHAHAAGRHDLLIDGVRLLATAFPWITLFTTGRTQLARLIELRADEVATIHHHPLTLARALVAIATAIAAPAAQPVLAATGGDAMQRLDRLLAPPPPLPRNQAWTITAALVALTTSPVALLATTLWFPALAQLPL